MIHDGGKFYEFKKKFQKCKEPTKFERTEEKLVQVWLAKVFTRFLTTWSESFRRKRVSSRRTVDEKTFLRE